MPNYARLFGEAVRESVVDYARDHPETVPLGWFIARLCKRGPLVPLRIWRDDDDALRAEVLGKLLDDPFAAMAFHQRQEVSEAEWRFRLEEYQWVLVNAPDEPLANPYRAIDLDRMPPPEF